MSALPPKADMFSVKIDVRLVPTADIAPNFIPSLPELTIGWGVAPKGKDRYSNVPTSRTLSWL